MLKINSEELQRLYINQLPMIAATLLTGFGSEDYDKEDAAAEAVELVNEVLEALASTPGIKLE